MADISATLVKELRKRTGAGIMECKKALIEANNNIELAIDNMRKSGQAKAIKKTGRVTAEGIILIKIALDGKYGIIIELNCETDFVAKDDNFKAFGDEIITKALNERITAVEILRDKFKEQHAALVTKISENVNIRRVGILEGYMLGSYLHRARIGVIISAANANEELIKHIAMHIAASNPEYINTNDVPTDVIAHEYQIQLNIAIQSGKSPRNAEKMVEGRIRKFIGDISLTEQPFIMDQSKTVGQLLAEHNAKINNFIRFEVGECIEKAKVGIAADVAKVNKGF